MKPSELYRAYVRNGHSAERAFHEVLLRYLDEQATKDSPGSAGSVTGNLAEATPPDVPSAPSVGRLDGSGEIAPRSRWRHRVSGIERRVETVLERVVWLVDVDDPTRRSGWDPREMVETHERVGSSSLQEQVYALQERLSECDEDDSRRLRLRATRRWR